MTAEIAIMNKEAIALAADSAVSMDERDGMKIVNAANKLFSLSHSHPVGIMIYGNAGCLGVPWETITHTYREKLGDKSFPTLEGYAKDFVAFLDKGNPLFPAEQQESHLYYSAYNFFNDVILADLDSQAEELISDSKEITFEDIRPLMTKTIKDHYATLAKTKNIPSIPKSFNKTVLDRYKKVIDRAIKDAFQELPLTRAQKNYLRQIATFLPSRFPERYESDDNSGIVIAGFGEKDYFPALSSFNIAGIVNNRLKFKEYMSDRITLQEDAAIVPFAQIDEAEAFIVGVSPNYKNAELERLIEMFDSFSSFIAEQVGETDADKEETYNMFMDISAELIDNFQKSMDDFQQETVSPVLTVVSMLPKSELAVMAESLVNLTSFKQKVSIGSETVGGPIDVAVISKGDGLIWIKKKQYFEPELNPQFFHRRFGSRS